MGKGTDGPPHSQQPGGALPPSGSGVRACPQGGPGASSFSGKGRTWGGRGAGYRAGGRLSCGGDGLSRSLTAPRDLASQRTFPSPRDVSGHGYSSVPGPAVLGEAAWTKGRTGEEDQGCTRGCKACSPRIRAGVQGHLSAAAFAEVQWTVVWKRIEELIWLLVLLKSCVLTFNT